MMQDGVKVAFVGSPGEPVAIGDQGLVISGGRTGSHVKWRTGGRKGQIDLVANDDLVVGAALARDALADSFEVSLTADLGVRSVYAARGARGLVREMEAAGHLASFPSYADEAIRLIAERIRQDPSFREVLAELDPDDGDEVIEVAARALLRDLLREVA